MNARTDELLKKGGDRTATFSQCLTYRYRLTRMIGLSARIACFVMLNPSTADELADDATIRRCVGFARREQCGELMVANLFAYRATDPQAMLAAADPMGPKNMDYIISAACRAHESGGPVIAAWGTHGEHLDQDRLVLAMLIKTLGIPVKCLGTTMDGFPRHPLRLSSLTSLELYTGVPVKGR